MAYRCLYELPLDSGNGCFSTARRTVSTPASLRVLSARQIVRDATQLAYTLSCNIPFDLYVMLMSAAFAQGKDRAVQVLYKSWPNRKLSLTDILPEDTNYYLGQYDRWSLDECRAKDTTVKTCYASLIHCFKESLSRRLPSRLSCVDLRGLPTDIALIEHLIKFCKRGYMIRDINVYVDLRILRISSADNLLEALSVCQSGSTPITVHICKLYAACIGKEKIASVLKAISPSHMIGLSLPYNTFGSKGLLILQSPIQALTNLTALDLSCNAINCTQSVDSTLALAATFNSLPCLERLDLSNNRFSGRLAYLLSRLKNGLKYLKLSATLLTEADILWLSCSKHSSTLRELDLSENNLGTCFPQLRKLILAIRDNIIVLELSEVVLSNYQLSALCALCQQLRHMCLLDISKNQCSWSLSVDSLQALCQIPTLRSVQLSYPTECYPLLNNDIDEEYKSIEDSRADFQQLGTQCLQFYHKIKLVCSELYVNW